MSASHGDNSMQGSLTAQKEHERFCRSTIWWSYRATLLVLQHSKCCRSVHFCQWNESEHVILPIIIIWHSVRWISEALNEHSLKFWALNWALNAEKTRDAQSTKSKFYEHQVISPTYVRAFKRKKLRQAHPSILRLKWPLEAFASDPQLTISVFLGT